MSRLSTFFKGSLSIRFAALVAVAGMLMLAVLGFYFDSFLQKSFLDSTETRMKHGFQRLAFDIFDMESTLQEGIAFINGHEPTLASIDLINNYEDKSNYNQFLIDEEKKLIAQELLGRVKLLFTNDLALYNQNDELIAYVDRNNKGYHLNIISYADGQQQLMRRYEHDANYRTIPLSTLADDGIDLIHKPFYNRLQTHRDSIITYHYRGQSLILKSHLSLFDKQRNGTVAHIEMSRTLDSFYFADISQDLDLNLSINNSSSSATTSSGSLFSKQAISNLAVQETKQDYIGTLQIDSIDGPVFLQARLERAPVTRVLLDNRQHLLLLLALVAICTLVAMHMVITQSLKRPLTVIMGQIRKIEQQDYSTSDQLTTGDELEVISSSINQLAETVRDRENALEHSRAELEYQSIHDALTELPNRRYWSDQLAKAREKAARQNNQFAILFIDLDQFKQVNDTQGHDVGDALLKQVSARLRRHSRSVDTLARIGGDEFNVLIENIDHTHELEAIAASYLSLFSPPFRVGSQEISISASIGIAIYPLDGKDSITLTKNADLAMYKAKERGRNNFSFFSNDLSEKMQQRAAMTHALKTAIKRGDEFSLHYQPKVSAASGRMVSVEALIRWQSRELGAVSPSEFITLAEELGLINPIGEWMLEQGCADFMRLKAMGIELDHIGINVSNIQLSQPHLLPTLLRIIERTGIPAEQLELEITESFIATDINEATNTLRTLRQKGLGIAIDDFGTGYSAIGYLQTLPATRLKIDKSFVDGLPGNRDNRALIEAVIGLAKHFQLALTAEGVETKAQLEFLTEAGCDEIQGYYYSKPLPFDELVEFHRTVTSTV